MARPSRNDAQPSAHPVRVPINGARNILHVRGIPEDLHSCWVNDTDDNLQRYLEAGYTFWTGGDEIGDKKVDRDSRIDAKYAKKVGNGLTAYLMVCPQEVYLDECRRIAEDTDAREQTIFRQTDGKAGRYGKVEKEKLSPFS